MGNLRCYAYFPIYFFWFILVKKWAWPPCGHQNLGLNNCMDLFIQLLSQNHVSKLIRHEPPPPLAHCDLEFSMLKIVKVTIIDTCK